MSALLGVILFIALVVVLSDSDDDNQNRTVVCKTPSEDPREAQE